MSKRFTDSNKWDDEWFMNLEPHYKLFWVYMLDKCDHAGFFKPNLKLANFCLDFTFSIDDLLRVFESRIQIVGSKWFIPKFIDFQYGSLKAHNNTHISILNMLKEAGVDQHLVKGWSRDKDKDQDKDKEEDKDNKREGIHKGREKMDDAAFVKSLRANPAYRHIDIPRELGKMDAWLSTHQGRQKTRRFIVNWLNKIDKPLTTGRVLPGRSPREETPRRSKEASHDPKVTNMIHETIKKMGG